MPAPIPFTHVTFHVFSRPQWGDQNLAKRVSRFLGEDPDTCDQLCIVQPARASRVGIPETSTVRSASARS